MLFEWWVERREDILALTRIRWPIRAMVYCYVALMLVCFPPPFAHEFIYFQF